MPLPFEDDPNDPVALDLNCCTCGGAIKVQLRPADAPSLPTRYTCPWCAAEEFRYQLPGDVLWVARGHHAKGVKAQ